MCSFHTSGSKSGLLEAHSTSSYSFLTSGPTPNTGVTFLGENRDSVPPQVVSRDSNAAINTTFDASSSRMRVQQPKEYKHGEDFSTLSFRYRIYVAS